ncbi:bidirectional sugar transporter NEC1-like isoform X2 [Salvia splendens]|uniref:bidirectional sugar transporter NEC1-like isoform X2 n=1 Tax=Salvia splendens TaxID=180675 RepID=UPI001C258295|nr:bidirectional sugar transporter NEC1-like isoform X2 [Salvia splendens]
MALFSAEHLAFLFGLLGNVISFLVFLAPMPTFYTIWKRKSSEGFQALPYSVAYFSASLLLYYAFLKTGAFMIITINGIGCFIETVYLLIYIIYAPKKSKRRVIKTKSVEYMPFTLSFFLTLCATMWFFYGFFVNDYYIAGPNILGFLFGIAQMILYFVYKNAKKDDGKLEPTKNIEKNTSLEEAKEVEIVSK